MTEPGTKPMDEFDSIADDLFAGAGGWDLAAQQLGLHARGIEIMPEARATREAAGLETIHNDVWTFYPDGRAVGGIASPPCPTFSPAGKGTGRKALDSVLCAIDDGAYRDLDQLREYPVGDDDDRTRLVLTPLHFATQHEYEWLAWEQVPTVLPVWEACAEVLRDLGWHVWTGKLHSEQYGVPQTRTRAFLIASRRGPVVPPTPTHSKFYSHDPAKLDLGVPRWLSMAEGLGWGLAERPSPTVTGGGTETGGAEPIAKLARYTGRSDWLPRDWQLVSRRDAPSWIAAHGERRNRTCDLPAPTITGEAHRWSWGPKRSHLAPSGSSATVVDPRPITEPAPTITGKGNAEWTDRERRANPGEMRDPDAIRLEPSEAGILQSFPADYPWQGNRGKQFLQAGNAVPPGMALHALSAASGIAIERMEGVA